MTRAALVINDNGRSYDEGAEMKIQNNRPNAPNRPINSNQGQANQGQNNNQANIKPNNQGTPNNKGANTNSNTNNQGGNAKGNNQSPNKSNSGNNQGGNKGNPNNKGNNKGNMSGQGGNKSNSHQGGNKNINKNSHSSSNNNSSSNSNSNYNKPNLIMGAPTYELPVKEQTFESEKKFTGRCRLFVANLPSSVTEESLKALFEQYGQVSEVFLGKQNSFAFVKMDTRKHAEEARSSLDNKVYEGKTLRVRLAAHAAAVRVKNLSHMVTNELLEYSFSYFGEVERAIVITDDRGRSIGEGIVEFARKSSAQNCIKKCTNECFLLTSHPAPVFIESFEQRDEDEGFGEKHVNKNSSEFRIERELGPRFADPGTFEFEFACRFKQLYEIEKERRSRLENEIQEARHVLLNQLEFQRTEHQTKLLKEKLREMEEKAAHYDELRNRTLEQEKMREQERAQQEMMLRQREEEILRRGQIQDYALLRRQENDLRQQANVLQDMLERVRHLNFSC